VVSGTRRKRSAHIGNEVRDAAVAALSASRQQRGLKARVRRVARELGVGERTVWRWLGAVKVQRSGSRRGSFSVTSEDIAELAYRHGNIAAVHRARGGSPSIWTLRRAFARALTPGQRAGLKGGEQTRRAFDTYLTRPATHRNECWEADHCQLAIEVILKDGQLIKPWLTSFVDRYSRAVCGWAISGYPSQESVLAALRAAILTEPTYGPVGGIPLSLRWDRGKEFLANAVASAARALGIDAQPLPAYTPHLKGAIERFHESIETLLLDELPGFVHAPERMGARPRPSARRDGLLTLDAFVTCFAEFIDQYNAERPHSSLDGDTPLERWLGDAAPLVEIPRERLHHLLLAQDTRVVGRRGIRMFGSHYNTAELVGLVGETVEVRYMPHRHESIEVFLRGRHLGTAVRSDLIDAHEARRLRRRRLEEERWLARQQREATRRRTRRFAAITEVVALRSDPEPEELPLLLKPSRSLTDYGPIPDDWVLPLPADQVPDPPPRRSTP
jgi:putative transposase